MESSYYIKVTPESINLYKKKPNEDDFVLKHSYPLRKVIGEGSQITGKTYNVLMTVLSVLCSLNRGR